MTKAIIIPIVHQEKIVGAFIIIRQLQRKSPRQVTKNEGKALVEKRAEGSSFSVI